MPLVATGVCVGSDKVPLIYYVHPEHSWLAHVRLDALRVHIRAPLDISTFAKEPPRKEKSLTDRECRIASHEFLNHTLHLTFSK